MMHRRSFPMPGLAGAAPQVNGGEPIVVKDEPGMPHRGKVFAAVHAHLDDIPYYAAGLCAKLMSEGYTGYILRTSNDERCGGRSTAENILSNEQDHFRMAAALGFKDVFDFYYQNHDMDGISYIDLRGRLILIFRMLQVDTILSFNPWGHAEENPDHWVTGRAVEEACWMAGMPNDFHEHLEAGIQPHTVGERYYFYAREGQPYNRVVDIGSHVEKKIDAIVGPSFARNSPGRESGFHCWGTMTAPRIGRTCASSFSKTTGSTGSRTTSSLRSGSTTSTGGRRNRRPTSTSRKTRSTYDDAQRFVEGNGWWFAGRGRDRALDPAGAGGRGGCRPHEDHEDRRSAFPAGPENPGNCAQLDVGAVAHGHGNHRHR